MPGFASLLLSCKLSRAFEESLLSWNTQESWGTKTHPEGVTGVSVECGTCSVQELAKNLPNNQIGVTTVGKVRELGGDVIKTSGKSPTHATMTGLSAEQMNKLLTPPVKNPWKKTPLE